MEETEKKSSTIFNFALFKKYYTFTDLYSVQGFVQHLLMTGAGGQ